MEKYNSDLSRLFNLGEKIFKLYEELIELEINDQKDTENYQKVLSKLYNATLIERKFYEKITSDKAGELIAMYFSFQIPSFDEYIDCIYTEKDNSLITARLINKLESIVKNDPNDNEESTLDNEYFDTDEDFKYPEEYDEEYDEDEDNLNENNFLEYNKYNALEDAIKKDILNTILVFLNNYINDSNYENIKPELIRYKYLLCYIFPCLESDFIDNSFEVKESLYWGSKLYIDYLKLNENILDVIKSDYAETILFNHCDYLINLLINDIVDNKDKTEHLDYVHAISSQIFIRACLLFIDEDTLNDYISYVISEVVDVGSENKVLTNVIFDSLNKFYLDLELPQVLSFRK